MTIFNDMFCQICDRFYTKEQWKKHLHSSRYLHREVNGYWPAFFPQKKLTRDEGAKLEKTFREMVFVSSEERIEVYDFLKTYFRMCTNISNHVPIRLWFDNPDEEEQWGARYRDDMIAQFKQDLYNKNFTLQDQGKDDPIDTLDNRIKFWINCISNAQGPVPDNLYDYGYNNEGLDYSVSGWDCEEIKKLLDILRRKMTRKNIKIFLNEIYSKPPKKIYPTNKTYVYHTDDIWSLDILDLKDYGPENNKGYRCVLVIVDNFSKYGWTIPLKKKCSNNKGIFRKHFDKFEKITQPTRRTS